MKGHGGALCFRLPRGRSSAHGTNLAGVLEKTMSLLDMLPIYVTGWLILYLYPRLRALALGRGRSSVMTDGDANLACLRVPRGWRQAGGVSDGPAIQIVDVFKNKYLTIQSLSKEDFDPDLDLDGFARMMQVGGCEPHAGAGPASAQLRP